MTPDPSPSDQGAARPLRYVAIGDSLTEGVGDDPWPDGTPRGWADRLAEILAHHHGAIDYANLAVRGYRTAQIHDSQLEAALAIEPDVVTFTAGMNDLLRPRFDREALLQALVDMVASCTERGTRVLVVPIPDIRSVLDATGRHGGLEHAVVLGEVAVHAVELAASRLEYPADRPEIVALYATNGAWDLVAELRTATLADFDRVMGQIRSVDRVVNSETSLLLRSVQL